MPGLVVKRLQEQAWDIRLRREGLAPAEWDTAGDSMHWVRSHLSERDPEVIAINAEFYRLMGREAWSLRSATDREIAIQVSEGQSIAQIKADLRVGQYRIERVVHSILGDKKAPKETECRKTKRRQWAKKNRHRLRANLRRHREKRARRSRRRRRTRARSST